MDLRHKFGIFFDILPIVPIRMHRTQTPSAISVSLAQAVRVPLPKVGTQIEQG